MSVTKKWEGYSENFSLEDSNIPVDYTCPWADRFDEKDDLLGSIFDDGTATLSWLVCTSCTIEPVGDPASTGGPETALLHANYTTKAGSGVGGGSGGQPGEEFIESWEIGCQALTIGEDLNWATDGVKLADRSQVKYFPQISIVFSGTKRSINKNAILPLVGCVNLNDWRGFSAGTLLFEGASLSKTWGGDGSGLINLSFKFSYNPNIWNMFWRSSTAKFEWLETDQNPYERGDFDTLW